MRHLTQWMERGWLRALPKKDLDVPDQQPG